MYIVYVARLQWWFYNLTKLRLVSGKVSCCADIINWCGGQQPMMCQCAPWQLDCGTSFMRPSPLRLVHLFFSHCFCTQKRTPKQNTTGVRDWKNHVECVSKDVAKQWLGNVEVHKTLIRSNNGTLFMIMILNSSATQREKQYTTNNNIMVR